METKRLIGYDSSKLEEVMDEVTRLQGLNSSSNMFSIFTLYSLLNESEDFIMTFPMEILEIVLVIAVNREYVLKNFNREEALSSIKSKLNRSLYVQSKYKTIIELSKEPYYSIMHKIISLIGDEEFVDVLTALSVLFKVDITDCVGSIDVDSVFSNRNTSKTLLTKDELEIFS